MSTTPEAGEARRRPVIAFVAYGVVLALLGWGGVALWTSGSREQPDLAGSRRAIPVGATTTQVETVRHDRTQEAPASPAPATQEPQQAAAAVSPAPQSETPAVATPQKPEPATAKCTLDPASWPADQTEQAKAIQILLRDHGFYAGTTYGTLGPATRAAIRKYQLAAGQAETGEPSEMLFESLKKKCAP
jgi:putative peptidoglycan binding protein